MFSFLREFGSSLIKSDNNIAGKTDDQADVLLSTANIKTTKSIRIRRKGKMAEELDNMTTKYPYGRPTLLGIRSTDELNVILQHSERLITLPKRSTLPRSAGYAECTNAGKSIYNEDQASVIESRLGITQSTTTDSESASEELQMLNSLDKLTVFGVFDGHAGADVAVTVSHELPHRIKKRICDVIQEIKFAKLENIQEDTGPQTIHVAQNHSGPLKRKPTVDRLVTGALEAAFQDMDANLIEDESQYTVKGGCATIVAIFYAGKLYVGNAGDCRAVLSLDGEPVVMSTDFNPEFERRRIQTIAEEHPDLLGDEFCPRQFTQRITRKDVGSQMLYRDSRMEGWAHKTVTDQDLRFPMIMGEGRRARLLATIGLTRGLGDHNLRVFDSSIKIKPFLSCIPEVQVKDLSGLKLTPDDVVIMGSDGLWDVITNSHAVQIVKSMLKDLPPTDNSRYIAAAQALVSYARGKLRSDRRDVWVMKDVQDYASHDDITCIVVPLLENPIEETPPADNQSESVENGETEEVAEGQEDPVADKISQNMVLNHEDEPELEANKSDIMDMDDADLPNHGASKEASVVAHEEPCVNSSTDDYSNKSTPSQDGLLSEDAKTLS